VFATATNSASQSLTIHNNTITNGSFYGLAISATVASSISGVISGNTISNHGDSGLNFVADNSGSISMAVFQNAIENNTSRGILLGTVGFPAFADGTYSIDIGGGNLGSIGHNSISGNGTFDVRDATTTAGTISAENNWWGTATPAAGQFSGTIDYTPSLTSDPN
jgi:hypothetical protein